MPQYDDGFLELPERGWRRYKVTQGHSTRPVTPTLLAVATLCDDRESGEESESSTTPNTKPRGGKLARRARSFKEDFLEILSQMRSPGGGGAQRSGSPHSPKTRTGHKVASIDTVDGSTEKNPLRDLDLHVKQVQFALKHFHDVVTKKKLEMLPGNGTIVLETVTTIHGVLKSYVLNEQSSTLVSATNKVYQSLAKLIKLCDDVLLQGEKALDKENVSEVIQLLEDAVQNLVSLAQDQIANRESSCKALINNNHHAMITDRTSAYAADLPHRSSLPDIPLTPRERQILEQTSSSLLDRHGHGSLPHSQSSESILNEVSPPPKPPLPGRTHHISDSCDIPCGEPPPLPPKRRNRPLHNHQSELQQLPGELDTSAQEDSAASMTDTLNSSSNTSGGGRVSGLTASFDRISLRSKSPEDTSSLLSASAGSLDSVLNHSREEEEIQVLMDPTEEADILTQSSAMNMNGSSCCCWDSSSSTTSTEQMSGVDKNPASVSIPLGQHPDLQQLDSSRKSPLFSTDLPPIAPGTVLGFDTSLGKLSFSHAESGFASMHSLRSSSHSYTSSQQISSRSSQQISSRSSQQSAVSYKSTESTSSKFRQVQHTTAESSVTMMHMQKTISSETPSPHHTEHSADRDVVRGISPDGDSVPNVPPALPQKTQSKQKKDRHLSTYDNVPSDELHSSSHQEQHVLSCSMHQSQTIQHNSCRSPDGKPPPLPPKKKHIMAYMEIFGNCAHPNTNEFLRHSVHTYNLLQAEWQQQEMSLTSTQSCSFSMVSSQSSAVLPSSVDLSSSSLKEISGLPPALPPKRSRTSSVKSSASPPPTSPPPRPQQDLNPKLNHFLIDGDTDQTSREEVKKPAVQRLELIAPSVLGNNSTQAKRSEMELTDESNPLEHLDITKYLVIKKPDEEGPDIRGGHPDALIIHATKANKNDFLYQEAFLTTYRTFLSPLDLIQKLCHRHERFSCSSDMVKQRAAREAFSLLVRVVSDLTMSDLDNMLLQALMDFVYQLLCSGDLTMAKALRVKIIEKCNTKSLYSASNMLLPSLNIYTRQASLLDFKSEQIAEQMTLLDAELFMKIEIPEVLIWAQEQNEERSPNLTRFTEHFNKMSYWARSRILEQNEAKDRERYVVKFIKIMKHLRKINNFNSYLALLSALDSAPIRRLEWQKQITEGLKEYCALIDSSSSFRAYRQALAETQPPCIPYIGLVLQDLTFVHIGNNDLLPEGSINFSKRWQQFNIVENMKRFKKGTYSFKKHERIIAFFNNFDEFLCEEAMWQISESIKPRGGKKAQ
ncbi:guanine nucleotide-releasing factor 2 isoform X2 [Zootermopsis nevadensis]|uniref:CRK SH3-binding GNRP n=1 Tax=Zootermopsis nevadensis TaxID=136037 RepID=A0A067QTZ8_ZOONE|nr:guanine nucleotide-releasing factor 2 isoform X2 [Zootermopsis nevadensis]KDR09115.1 Guanine nucleotide-releasing factor 2 [Zootermopsis nevadensis]